MLNFIRACKGEIIKQNQNYYNTWQTYISLLLWPLLNCFVTYFMYKSFDISALSMYGIESFKRLLIFIYTGLLGYNCFWAMVQSALFMRDERENGTIEIVFMTSANRLAIVYGRALGGIIQNVWMFLLFTLLIVFTNSEVNVRTIVMIPIGFIVLIISAVLWGGFINSIFLISRDVDFWFNICDSPMELLSGVKIPVAAFPVFIKAFSVIFPLTHCLMIVRNIFMGEEVDVLNLILLLIVLCILVFVTVVILHVAEKHNRKTGSLQLY